MSAEYHDETMETRRWEEDFKKWSRANVKNFWIILEGMAACPLHMKSS